MVEKVEVASQETTAEKPEEKAIETVETKEVQQEPKQEKILGKFDTQEDLIKSLPDLCRRVLPRLLGTTGRWIPGAASLQGGEEQGCHQRATRSFYSVARLEEASI